MMKVKKKEQPTPTSEPQEPERVLVGFAAHLLMNGWGVVLTFNDGTNEEYAFVGENASDELHDLLFKGCDRTGGDEPAPPPAPKMSVKKPDEVVLAETVRPSQDERL